jgi:hypothetical protein
MAFSFADLGFWRLAVLALIFELAHGALEVHWPGIRGSRLGPRPLAAVLFMFAESLVLMAAIAAAIGTVGKMLRSGVQPMKRIAVVTAMTACLIGICLLVWQY